jgi:hypothetical protein
MLVATSVSVSAQQQFATAVARRLGMRATATIQASAINSTNGALANTSLRLRDARLGRIVENSLTDKFGAYTFKGLDPGNYIVEIVSNDQTAIAATNLINANAGETVAVVVRLPFKPSLFGTLLGQAVPGQGTASTTSGLNGIVPNLAQQLTQTIVQLIPAIVPVGPPASDQ